MNHSYHSQTLIDSPEVCYQSYPTIPLNQSHDYMNPTLPVKQEPTTLSSCAMESKSTIKLTELKFKMESVGIPPKDDDDLDMCPARVRPGWPEKIIPWWIPLNNYEKPPYSYATLIAHAILSSKDGRLTLNDIYIWISKNYPTFSLGVGGWQNSIRHNLSLNKKWFLKIDRRPTQANPGKGCYWTLVAGKEHIFITNITQEGGYNKKHYDIGLTAELSLGQRRGVCFYHSVGSNEQQSLDVKVTTAMTLNNNALEHQYGLTTPPLTPTKPELSRPLLSPLYTTFRMVSENAPASPNKKRSRRKLANVFTTDESEYDSGVDLSSEYFEGDRFQKRHRASSPPPFQESYEACDTPLSGTFLTESHFSSSDWEHSSDQCTAKSQDMLSFPQVHWPWTMPDSAQLACFAKHPSSIDLENNPLSQKYLPFREDSALIQSYYSPYILYPPHPNPFVSMQDILYS